MKRKSLLVSILSAVVLGLGAYAGFFNEVTQAWLSVVSMVIVACLTRFAPSGEFKFKGTEPFVFWGNVLAILIQAGQMISEQSLMNPQLLLGIMIGLNIVVTGFMKDYSGTELPK